MAKGRKTGGRNFSSTDHPRNGGRPRLPEDLRAANKLTKERLNGLLNKYLWMSLEDIQAKMECQETPAMEVMIGSIIKRAIIEGDHRRLDFILDRIVGKVREEIDISGFIGKLEDMTEAEVIELSEQAIRYLRTGNE